MFECVGVLRVIICRFRLERFRHDSLPACTHNQLEHINWAADVILCLP